MNPNTDQQNTTPPGTNHAEKHQIWCEDTTKLGAYAKAPRVYKLDVNEAEHSFTSSQVLAINNQGQPVASFHHGGNTTLPPGPPPPPPPRPPGP